MPTKVPVVQYAKKVKPPPSAGNRQPRQAVMNFLGAVEKSLVPMWDEMRRARASEARLAGFLEDATTMLCIAICETEHTEDCKARQAAIRAAEEVGT